MPIPTVPPVQRAKELEERVQTLEANLVATTGEAAFASLVLTSLLIVLKGKGVLRQDEIDLVVDGTRIALTRARDALPPTSGRHPMEHVETKLAALRDHLSSIG